VSVELKVIVPLPGQLSEVGVAVKLNPKLFAGVISVAIAKLKKIKFFTRQKFKLTNNCRVRGLQT
jgi:hypothetical protein